MKQLLATHSLSVDLLHEILEPHTAICRFGYLLRVRESLISTTLTTTHIREHIYRRGFLLLHTLLTNRTTITSSKATLYAKSYRTQQF